MAPRLPTIEAFIVKAITQIEADKCSNALRTLHTLENKMGKNHNSKPKAPNAYAKFVKEQYPHFQKQHPNLPATKIMVKIAAAWHEHKASHHHK